jgi:hypothetical protein
MHPLEGLLEVQPCIFSPLLGRRRRCDDAPFLGGTVVVVELWSLEVALVTLLFLLSCIFVWKFRCGVAVDPVVVVLLV